MNVQRPATTAPALTSADPSRRPSVAAGIAGLTPACFGIVMATGIVSLACASQGLPRLAQALLGLNIGLYALLWLLLALRLLQHPRRVLADLSDHGRGPGFFTVVAGTGVLGVQVVELGGAGRVGLALGAATLALWFVITYALFTALTVKPDKPALERGINGGWLLAVVATQSIAVLGTVSGAGLPPAWQPAVSFLALAMWLWGGMLYILLMALILYRLAFFRLSPAELGPPYWINMGAMAISTLAGARLALAAPQVPLLHALEPFVKGFTVFYWASGSWWIPMLLALGVWRHLIKRFPLRYDPLYWSAVFPLGMYAQATHEMTRAMDLPFLAAVPPVFLAAALAAWGLAMAGLLVGLLAEFARR